MLNGIAQILIIYEQKKLLKNSKIKIITYIMYIIFKISVIPYTFVYTFIITKHFHVTVSSIFTFFKVDRAASDVTLI